MAELTSPLGVWALLWGEPGQFHELRIGAATCWIPCDQPRALTRLLVADDAHVSVVPRTARDKYALGKGWLLSARLESPESADRLSRVPVPPTLVAREGGSSRRTALWWLSVPLDADWVTRASERLAHFLKSRRGAADASALMVSPFTRLTVGRKKPQRVYVEYQTDARSTARQIVGRMADAPATDGWREKRTA